MHFLAVSLRKDWARVRRDPFSLLTALGIPLVLAVLMSLVFGREPATPQGRLLIADEDNSIASNRLLEAFHYPPLDQMLHVEKVALDAGRARIDSGDASAFLIVPKGFQQAFLLNRPFRLQLFTNPSQRILPQMIQETLSIAVDAAFYLRRANFAPNLSPPLIELDTAVVHDRRPTLSFAAVFLPSMVFMGLLFIASSMAGDIWKERTQGTLRRVASSPVSMASYLAARVVFVAQVYAIVALVGLVAANRLAGAQPAGCGPVDDLRGYGLLPALPVDRRRGPHPASRQRTCQPHHLPARHARRLLLPLRMDARLDGHNRQAHA